MPADNNRPLGFARRPEDRPRGVDVGPVRERLGGLFRRKEDRHTRAEGQRLARLLQDERGSVGEEVLPRFPLARQGYECAAVDEHIAELERELAAVHRELAELTARAASPDEVASEIKRIGEQTSAVLIAAHEQREEIVRGARAQADRLVGDATATAAAATAQGEARLRELEAKTRAAHRERDRLLDDARAVSAALAALADSAHERIPPASAVASTEPEGREPRATD